MSFRRPTLPQLIERGIADIEALLPGADARLRQSNLNVLSRVNAGAAHGLYGYLDWLARQILPDTAEAEYLERHARIWLPEGRLPASYARGEVRLTGADGTVIPAGTILKRPDGAAFATENEGMIVKGVADVSVTAETTGRSANTAAGAVLNLDSPIAGIEAKSAVGNEGINGGADLETDAALLTRLLDRIQQPPQGGAAADYIAWTRAASPAVTRVWVYPLEMGEGTVTVRFVCDDAPDILPDPGLVRIVQDHIDTLRPVTAQVFVLSPLPFPVHFVIAVTPNTAAVRAAVEASLRDTLIREAQPEPGESGTGGAGRVRLTRIASAISLSAGVIDYELIAPSDNLAPGPGEMAVFGSITWQ